MNSEQLRSLILNLAAESKVDPRTVERWLKGESVQRATDSAIVAATEKLKLEKQVTKAKKAAKEN